MYFFRDKTSKTWENVKLIKVIFNNCNFKTELYFSAATMANDSENMNIDKSTKVLSRENIESHWIAKVYSLKMQNIRWLISIAKVVLIFLSLYFTVIADNTCYIPLNTSCVEGDESGGWGCTLPLRTNETLTRNSSWNFDTLIKFP